VDKRVDTIAVSGAGPYSRAMLTIAIIAGFISAATVFLRTLTALARSLLSLLRVSSKIRAFFEKARTVIKT
jgi:hypothetical protein